MNRAPLKIITLMLSVLFMSGCYNNSHIRSQRILEPGDKVLSGYASANLISSDNDYESYDIRHGGIAGMRAGLSYLTYRKGYEQGLDIGYGGGSGDYNSLILGYDIRKVIASGQARPYRYGMHAELNNLLAREDRRIQKGSVIQLRPYLISATSDLNDWYAGIHGLMSFGNIESMESINGWSSEEAYSYQVSSLGLGVTMGNEIRLGEVLVQTQLDVSYLSQQHETDPDDFAYFQSMSNQNFELDPLNNSGVTVTVGMAISQTPQSQLSRRFFPQLPMDVHSYPREPQSGQKFDPFTGEQISVKPESPGIRFDPFTGELIKATPAEFDPFTGLPVQNENPQSLLSPNERSILLMKGLKIISLNGTASTALVQDVKSNGLAIYRESKGKVELETISYEDIRIVRFEGGRRGFKKGMSSALTGCGICIALPLSASLITGESDFFFIGLSLAPAVGLGTLLLSSLDPDKYEIQFNRTPSQQTDVEYKKRVFVQLVKQYIESGFPAYELSQLQPKP